MDKSSVIQPTVIARLAIPSRDSNGAAMTLAPLFVTTPSQSRLGMFTSRFIDVDPNRKSAIPLRFHGQYDFLTETRAHHRVADRGEPHPQDPVAPPDPRHAPFARIQGRRRSRRSGSEDLLHDRPLREMGHHQEEHRRSLQEPPDRP